MRIKTSTILLYQIDKVNIIKPVGKEVMINEKAYTAIDGEIHLNFIIDFYSNIKN
jgi:hypothetical protein